ncbi:MAG: hypothetical protein IGS50_17535 [Synechococcales cyanobacterium C42_A2020_086]|nr:hypothetical protein [Synechococcales cyanobacterium C42_A2020_086]
MSPSDLLRILITTARAVLPILAPLCLLNSPLLLLLLVPDTHIYLYTLLYICNIFPILWGASFFFSYRYLGHQSVSLRAAFDRSIRRANRLIISMLTLMLLCAPFGFFFLSLSSSRPFWILLFAGVFLLSKSVFCLAKIVLDDTSAVFTGVNASWDFVGQRWLFVFIALLVEFLVLFLFGGYVVDSLAGFLELLGSRGFAQIIAALLSIAFPAIDAIYWANVHLALEGRLSSRL